MPDRFLVRFLSTALAVAICASCRSTDPFPNHDLQVTPTPVSASQTPNARLFAELDAIDPAAIDEASPLQIQVLSILGREDLIADVSPDHRAKACAPAPGVRDADGVLDTIAARAEGAQVVIVNEAHLRADHRHFVEDVATRLAPLGFTHYAAEAFVNAPDATPLTARHLKEEHGLYTKEPAFAALGRTLRRLGYTLHAYEQTDAQRDAKELSGAARINAREAAQAENLTKILTGRTGAKILIHAGHSHARESVDASKAEEVAWMAARLKERAGVDPLTINQTRCSGGAERTLLAAHPDDPGAQDFDIYVDHPLPIFQRSRPTAMYRAGPWLDIPLELMPEEGWAVIEARYADEPDDAVPVDRVVVWPREDVAIALAPGAYRLRAVVSDKPAANR
ncbi:MAG: hypothetical protein AAFX08_09680 [Pseudomonadota bacterium]